MKYISLFSGIEAATVAWHGRLPGWEPQAFAEIDPFPSAVLNHHWPEVENLGDITKVDWSKYHGKIDLIVGGSPCQSFSLAGLRGSLDDDRGNLALEFVRIIHAVQPRWFIWENVPGALSTRDNAFGCILAGFVGADAPLESGQRGGKWPGAGIATGPGYGVAWRVLDAQHFGVTQRRRRIFAIGCSRGWRPAAAVLFESKGVCGDSSPSLPSREEAPSDARSGASRDGGGSLSRGKRGDFHRVGGIEGTAGESGVAPILATGKSVSDTVTSKWAKGSGGPAGSEAGNLVLTPAPASDVLGIDAFELALAGAFGDLPSRLQQAEQNVDADYLPTYRIHSDAVRDGVAVTPSPDGKGGTSIRNPGMGVSEDGAMYTLMARGVHGVAQPKVMDSRGVSTTPTARSQDDGSGEPEPTPTFAIQDVRAVEKAQGGLGVGKANGPSYTLDTLGTQGVAHPALAGITYAFAENQRAELRLMEKVPALTISGGKPGQGYPAVLTPDTTQPSYGVVTKGNGEGFIQEERTSSISTGGGQLGQGRPAVLVPEMSGSEQPVAFSSVDYGGDAGPISPTLRAAAQNAIVKPVQIGYVVRRLTPIECERLQGFPDNYTLIPYRNRTSSDSARYKALGNSMAVPVMYWIGLRIDKVNRLLNQMDERE